MELFDANKLKSIVQQHPASQLQSKAKEVSSNLYLQKSSALTVAVAAQANKSTLEH